MLKSQNMNDKKQYQDCMERLSKFAKMMNMEILNQNNTIVNECSYTMSALMYRFKELCKVNLENHTLDQLEEIKYNRDLAKEEFYQYWSHWFGSAIFNYSNRINFVKYTHEFAEAFRIFSHLWSSISFLWNGSEEIIEQIDLELQKNTLFHQKYPIVSTNKLVTMEDIEKQ